MPGPTVTTFQEARKLHNPPKLITYVEFDTGGSRATLSGFESKWRAVGTGGHVTVATSINHIEGYFSNKFTWDTSNSVSIVATTIPATDLSSLETVRFFVRSTVTQAAMRIGFGETSAGEYLPTVNSIVTANTFVEREFSIDTIPVASRNAIRKLRLEMYGKSGVAAVSGVTYLDNMYAIKRSRFANIFQIRPGSGDEEDSVALDLEMSADVITTGHAMNDTQAMDDSSPMNDGIFLHEDGATSRAMDLSNDNTLIANFFQSAGTSSLRFGFGESTSTEKTFTFSLVTAGVNVAKVFDISTMPAANRNTVRYFRLDPITVPTSSSLWECAVTYVQGSNYFSYNPIRPYRVFLEKVADVAPIVHSIGHVQDQARIANTNIDLTNHDSEFYTLRAGNNFLNRNVNIKVGFENFPESQSQTVFKGRVKEESIDDYSYHVEAEDVIERTLRDIPPNAIQNKVYVTPAQALSYGLGEPVNAQYNPFAPGTDTPVPDYDKPDYHYIGLPIPMLFGKQWIQLMNLHRSGFWMGTTRNSPIAVPWAYNDESFGKSSGAYNVVAGHYGGEFHHFGIDIGTATGRPFGQFGGWWTDKTRGILWIFGGSDPKVKVFAQADGYVDDTSGTWSGSANRLITNPSDVTRFILMNVIHLDSTEVDLAAMDTARTALTTTKVARALNERESVFNELGGRASEGGLASNAFAYFFTSNVNGKAKMLYATATGSVRGTYRSTGVNANIIKGSYKSRSQVSKIITRVEIESGYNIASSIDKSFVTVVNHQAESFAGGNIVEPLRIRGNWIPADNQAMTIQYTGTSLIATHTLLGEDNDTEQLYRFTSPIAGQSFSIDLNAASGNTVSKLKNIIDGKAYMVATLNSGVISSLDSRGLRSFGIYTGFAQQTFTRVKYGHGKRLAWKYLDRYDQNRNLYTWRSPWVGYQQEIGEYVNVRSLGEVSGRIVQVIESRKEPLSGIVDFVGEEQG